jgi:hypothetical protein
MATEMYNDNNPKYIYNRHTSYENTVLQEHAAIVSGLRDTGVTSVLIETQARLFIGMCIKGDYQKFIKTNYETYYKDEYAATVGDTVKREQIAHVRTWTRLINDALDMFIKKYKVDGSLAKIAVLDYETMDGRPIVEAEQVIQSEQVVDFTKDDKGL